MELKSVLLCVIVTMIIIETSTGTHSPPPAPSGELTCPPELMTCQGGSTPSRECCTALRRVHKNEQTCLCQLGMNGTQVSDILVKCHIGKATTTFCNASSPVPAPSPFSPVSPFSISPAPGSESYALPPIASEASVMYKATWVWWSGLTSFLLFVFFDGIY